MNRRDFLKMASVATLGALAAGAPEMAFAEEATRYEGTADTVIILWMGGGMAHTETFDPKRYTPYESGLASEKVLSTFPSIPTAVDRKCVDRTHSKGLGYRSALVFRQR